MSLINNLELTFSERRIDWKHPILILDFLASFTEEFDILGMTEGQAFMELPKILTKTEEKQYRARQHGGHTGGITAWRKQSNTYCVHTRHSAPFSMHPQILE